MGWLRNRKRGASGTPELYCGRSAWLVRCIPVFVSLFSCNSFISWLAKLIELVVHANRPDSPQADIFHRGRHLYCGGAVRVSRFVRSEGRQPCDQDRRPSASHLCLERSERAAPVLYPSAR